MARWRVAVMAAVFAAAWVAVAAQGSVAPTSHDHCDELVRQHPGELDVYRCYSVIARQTGDYLGAEQRLQNILSVQTGNAPAKMALANLLLDRARVEDTGRVRRLLGEAVETFADRGNQSGEVLTRMSLSWFLENIGEDEQAASQLDLAGAAAEGNPALEIRVQTRRADRAFKLDDYSGALALYQGSRSADLSRTDRSTCRTGCSTVWAVAVGPWVGCRIPWLTSGATPNATVSRAISTVGPRRCTTSRFWPARCTGAGCATIRRSSRASCSNR